jgi:hypothetical protein
MVLGLVGVVGMVVGVVVGAVVVMVVVDRGRGGVMK